MFQTIRKHTNPATIMSFFALMFAMSGGAYAMGSHGGSSGGRGPNPTTASVARSGSNTTLATAAKSKAKAKSKSTTGARGPAGPAGKTGPAGPAGPVGLAGPAGEKGAAGTNGTNGVGTEGKEGPAGKNGTNGKEGSPWTATGALPPGKTETGSWVLVAAKEIGSPRVEISFPIPLKEGLESGHVLYVGEAGNGTTCPGSAEEPQAAEGDLCVYEATSTGVVKSGGGTAEALFFDSGSGDYFFHLGTTGVAGTVMALTKGETSTGGTPEPEVSEGWGTWAVTAPAA